MSYQPGDNYYKQFTTQAFNSGIATDADTLPVATVTKNGVDDGSSPTGWDNTLTVTKLATGRYKVTGAIPDDYADGDHVEITIAATVGGVAAKASIDSFRIDTSRLSDLATSIVELNDLDSDAVQAAAAAALSDYDGPTKTEMDARIDAVDSAIAALNDISAAVVEQAAQDGAQAAIDAAGLLTAEVLEGLASYRQLRAFARGKVVIDTTAGTWTFYDTDNTTVLYTLAVTAVGRTVS